MDNEDDCKCMKIIGHLEAVKWLLWPRRYQPSPGILSLGDWTKDPHIWLHYVESSDGVLITDDVLFALIMTILSSFGRFCHFYEERFLYSYSLHNCQFILVKDNNKSTDSRYWSIHDVQRYFFGEMHCEQVLFTYQYPNLRMPTRLGSHFWKSNTALKLQSSNYLKEFHRSLEITLKKMEANQVQMDRLIISDQLINIDRLDYFKRQTFFRILLNIISLQDRLQLASFENLCCKRLEGVRLIQQLACFNAQSLKYLFLWRFVLPNENPLLINFSYITGSGQYIPRPDSRHCFLTSLGQLTNLRVLGLEYSHIADGNGSALIALLPILKRPHFRLQLICRENQTPGQVDASLGVGGYEIPDTAWRRITIACPNLYLFMTFHRIRDYDNIRRFLSPSIPLYEVHMEFGIDIKMKQRQDSDISCFIRHIAHYYANTLVTISVHQWRFAAFPLRRIFETIPQIVRFFYVGKVEDEVDLKRMLQIIACGICNRLRQVRVQIQDEVAKRTYWLQVVETLSEDYENIMNLYDINFCLDLYKN